MKRVKTLLKFVTRVMKKWWWVLLILAGAIFFVVRWFMPDDSTTSIRTAQVYRGDIREALEISGEIRAKEIAVLRFPMGGRLTYIGVQQGEPVRKWQTLASIDRRDLEKTLERSVNTFERQRLTNEQVNEDNKDIHGDNAIDRVIKQDSLTIQNAALDVELQNLALQNTSIWAPFDGILVRSPTNVPGTIVAGSDVFVVVNPNSLYFSADLDESDLGLVQEGQSAVIRLDAYPDNEIRSEIRSIAFESSQSSIGTVFAIEFPFSDEQTALQFESQFRIGMSGTVEIILEEKNDVLIVNESAVFRVGDQSFVTVIRNGKQIEVEVEIGIEGRREVEILSGLEEDDLVLLQ